MIEIPTQIQIGEGTFEKIGPLLESLKAKRIFVILDPGLVNLPWVEKLERTLSRPGIQFDVFQEVKPNPLTLDAEVLAKKMKGFEADWVLAIGGGSALDLAKGAALLARNQGPAKSFIGVTRFANDPIPLIAVPTTCGTGSEVTWVSVLTDPTSKRKISIKGPQLFPKCAFVDPNLLETLPAYLVAETGMDALTHALEAFTGKRATPDTDKAALKAIGLIFENLFEASYGHGSGQKEAKARVFEGSTLAGLAFGQSDVGGVHCLSESLGGAFDVPHGLTNAILLDPVLKYHRPFIGDHLKRIAESVWFEELVRSKKDPSDLFFEKLSLLKKTLKIPEFRALKIPNEKFPLIAKMAEENGSNPSNPQKMEAGDYLTILNSL